MTAIEGIDISDSENEEEKYVTIFYRDSSTFIQFPVEDDGKLLFIDIKVIEPNIFGLYLAKGDTGKLLKPKNGCFKEPKEGWEKFKVFAVLKDAENPFDLSVSSHDNTASVKSEVNELPFNILEDVKLNKRKNQTFQSSEQLRKDTSLSFSPALTSTPNGNFNETFQSQIHATDEITDEVTDDQIFSAYNVSSYDELKKLLCEENPLFHKCFENTFHQLKRTMTAYPMNEIIKVLYYAYRSKIPFNKLDPNAPVYCEHCHSTKLLLVNHVVSDCHVLTHKLKFNADPPELSTLLDSKYYYRFCSPDLFLENSINKENSMNKSFDYLINRFYPKDLCDTVKEYFCRRIVEENLNLLSKDPLFIEKFLFLRNNIMQHPFLKNIFPSSMFCNSCGKKSLEAISQVMGHLLSRQHISLSLTQEELNKIHHAISFIRYSATGYFYLPNSLKNRKRYAKEHGKEGEKRQRMQ